MNRERIMRRPREKSYSLILVMMVIMGSVMPGFAQSTETSTETEWADFGGPDSTKKRIASDRVQTLTPLDFGLLKPWYKWKDNLQKEHGLALGIEYNAVYLKASDSLPGTDDYSGAGIFRFRGAWEAFGRGTDHSGTLMFVVEHTHDFTDTLPNSFEGKSLGYAGISNINYNDDGLRLNTLYWDQMFQNGRYEVIAGFLDISDYVDVYPLTSPWTDFFNYAFSIGAGALDLANDGALGFAGAAWLTQSVYVMAGLVDQNSDPTDPFEGFDTFWNDHEFFKHIEIGWAGVSQEAWFLNNVHLTLWHADEREKMGVEDGWGGVLSFNHSIDKEWLVFVRGGYSDDGGSLLERSVSIGAGYTPGGLELLGSGSQLGLAANWGRPNEDLLGPDIDDQYAFEIYFRWMVSDELAITPGVQLLIDPALNPDENNIWLFGLRARFAL